MSEKQYAQYVNDWINEVIRISGRHCAAVISQELGRLTELSVSNTLAFIHGRSFEDFKAIDRQIEIKRSLLEQAWKHVTS